MSYSKLKRRVAKAKELGLTNILMCFFTRFRFKRLHRKFKFDPWHCEGTWHCRPYQRIAVKIVNKITPRTVVEVGCGLGEIISRVNAPKRAGYDLEEAVINAARYLRGSKVDFQVGSGSAVKEPKIDVLIALNWIHNLSPEEMREFLEPFYNRAAYFLLEGITPGQPGYRFHHDFSFLDGHAELVEATAGGVGEPRSLMLFKVVENEF
jgi:hypothetical protein